MRDDFGIPEIKLFPYKVALTWDQVQELDLPPGLAIKTGGKRGKSFKAKAKSFKNQYGDRTWEVEAVDEAVLQQITRDAIDAVLDVDQFNEQVEIEKSEIRRIKRLRTKAVKAINEVIAEDAT